MKDGGEDFNEIAILDSSNHKNVMVRRWMERYTNKGEGIITKMQELTEPATIFTLGDKKRIKSEGQCNLSMLIHWMETELVVDVIDADLLLLILREEIKRLDITLHLDEDEIECNGKRSALIITDDGLPAIGVRKKRRR